MNAKSIILVLMGGMLAMGCGVAGTSSSASTSQPQVQAQRNQTSATPAQSASSFKPDYAFEQPEVDASGFESAQELVKRMESKPSTLSLKEYYAASKAYEPGSEGFNKVYETAAKYYPNDEIVNVNRANAKMQAGDTVGAKTFLDKAGEGAAAVYSRGVWYAKRGNIQQAVPYFRKADGMGYPKATAAIRALAGAR